MATHDYVLANASGAAFRTDLNNALAAIVSNNSSSSEPSTKYAYQWWADTNTGILKIRNSANNGWVELLQLDGTLTLEDGSVSTPGLAFRDDLNTGVFSSGADTFNIAVGGVERVKMGTTAVVFNDDGNDIDFRIEGDSEGNLFYVDASTDRIGIGTASPDVLLHATGSSGTPQITVENTSNSAREAAINIKGKHSNGTVRQLILKYDNNDRFRIATAGSLPIAFETADAERMRIDTSGRLLLGTTTEGNGDADEFTIANTSGANMGMTIRSGTGALGNIFFSDGTSGGSEYRGMIQYGHNDDSMRFATGETERMRIDSVGRVAIQGEATRGLLEVRASGGSDTMLTAVFGANEGITGGTLTNNNDKACRIGVQHYNSGGTKPFAFLVGSGTSGANNLNIGGGTSLMNGATTIQFSTDSGTTNNGGTERMRINSSGTLFLGKTSQSSGTAGVELYADGPNFMTRNASGGSVLGLNDQNATTGDALKIYYSDVLRGSLVYNGSSFFAYTASDYRLKENDTPISDGITRVKQLRPVKYNWKTDATKTYDGFIAHEVQAVVPDCVVGEKDAEVDSRGEGYQRLAVAGLVPVLTAALKEAIAKIETLETKVAALEAA